MDKDTSRLIIHLSKDDYSKLQLLSESTSIPLPILSRALLKQAICHAATEDRANNLLFRSNGMMELSSLSNREMEIFKLLVQGLSNNSIAEAFRLSEQTVKNHVSSILRKIKANNRTQAALLALKCNQIQPGMSTGAELKQSETVKST